MSNWTQYPTHKTQPSPTIMSAWYRLSDLVAHGAFDSPTVLAEYQAYTALLDGYWQMVYSQDPDAPRSAEAAVQEADGFAILLHGWDGTHRTWEDMPERLVEQYPKLVCLCPDTNGFGGAPFITDDPRFGQARLDRTMRSIEYLIDLLGLRNLSPRTTPPFFLFIGHSMGGGAIFYKDQLDWQNDVYGCYAMGPSMFYMNRSRKFLYAIVSRLTWQPWIPIFLKNIAAKLVILIAMRHASQAAQQVHEQSFYATSKNVLASTLHAISVAPKSYRTDWSQYRLALGHKDALVRLFPTVKMVLDFGFKAEQIKILIGDHYFFSADDLSPASHHYNRQLIIDDVLDFAHQLARQVKGKD